MKINMYSRLLLTFSFVVLLILSSCRKENISEPVQPGTDKTMSLSNETQLVANAADVPVGFKLVGYLPSYQGSVSNVQFNKLTHVIYAFATPHTDGSVDFDYSSDLTKFQSTITAAHAAGVKVLIAVGGGGNGDAFKTIISTATGRATFTSNMVAFCNQYNCDGVDIDWEYPNATETPKYTLLEQQLSTALHNAGKLSTAAVVCINANYVTTDMMNALDWLNIMNYDDNNYQHSTYQSAVNCLNYWQGRGLAVSKTVLGLPFYARDNTVNYGTKNYSQILAMGGSPNADTFNGRYGYNGIPTVKQKTTLALGSAGGIMMWDLGGDVTGTNSLLSAIYSVASVPSGPPIGHIVSFKGYNGKFVSGNNGTGNMTCTKSTDGSSEHFSVIDAGNGYVYLRSNGLYVSSENGTQAMRDNRTTASGWETFAWGVNSNGTVTLRAVYANNAYVSSENGTQDMTCNRATPVNWESFTVTIVQ